ncbi:MAG: shikimate dehydrogenase [Lewinellaceae bacterium]|nr:shikimate dehydrogenase [Lewinellaceae bacterium]
MQQYGLIGYPLGHSFSQRYFSEKFAREGISDSRYDLFPLPDIGALPELLEANPDLCGLNVTIPHKKSVLPYLHKLDETAQAVGAVNAIRIRNNQLTGFNTDAVGFQKSLTAWLTEQGRMPMPDSPSEGVLKTGWMRAVILGTGGAAAAVAFVLKKMQIDFVFVSRTHKGQNTVSYEELHGLLPNEFTLIVHATPAGTYPDLDTCPPVPFDLLHERHLVFDLVYNPAETLLLRRAGARGAAVKNGLEMLQLQAEAAWDVWTK